MKCDIVLAGVGGQGILTIAYLLDNAAIARGLDFKQAEVHGMSQRGGAVYSHLRISDGEVISDLIPLGQADLIIAVEPLEVQRYVNLLSPTGTVVTSNQPFVNIPNYPDEKAVISALFDLPNCLLVNAKEIASKAGAMRAQNMAVLGAAIPFLPFGLEDFAPSITSLFTRKGEHVVESNMNVLRWGGQYGAFYKALLDAGVDRELLYNVAEKLDVTSIDAGLASDFAGVLAAEAGNAASLLDSLESRLSAGDLLARLSS